jgi:hypothetical protein
MDSYGSEQEPKAGPCEHNSEHSDCIERESRGELLFLLLLLLPLYGIVQKVQIYAGWDELLNIWSSLF